MRNRLTIGVLAISAACAPLDPPLDPLGMAAAGCFRIGASEWVTSQDHRGMLPQSLDGRMLQLSAVARDPGEARSRWGRAGPDSLRVWSENVMVGLTLRWGLADGGGRATYYNDVLGVYSAEVRLTRAPCRRGEPVFLAHPLPPPSG